MGELRAISRKDLIKRLAALGFEGPYAGGKHSFMVRSSTKVWIPNPHGGQISVGLLARLLKQAGISKEDW